MHHAVLGWAGSGALVWAAVAAPPVGTGQTVPVFAPADMRPETPLIPRATLLAAPRRVALQLSPDGRRLAFLAPVAGVANIWVGPADAPGSALPVTDDDDVGIAAFSWALTSQDLLFQRQVAGSSAVRLYRLHLPSGEFRDLTPAGAPKGPDGQPLLTPGGAPFQPSARLLQLSGRFPEHVLVGFDGRDPRRQDVHRVNIRTGAADLVLRDPGAEAVFFDEEFRPRVAARTKSDGALDLFRAPRGGSQSQGGFSKWESLLALPPSESRRVDVLALHATGSPLYLSDSRGRDTAALVAMDVATGETTLLAADARADLGEVLLDPVARAAQAASFMFQRQQWSVVDRAIEADLTYLRSVARGDMSIVSRSRDDQRWIVAFQPDTGPTRYFLHDRGARRAAFLLADPPELEGQPLQPMHSVVVKARDGLDLLCHLTLPAASDPDGDSRPAGPVPLVLLVRGGPWERHAWGYDAEHQWLANRGYAALSVNHRGSSGFGHAFVAAGDKQWGARMQEDLLDAVAWAVAEKIADPAKVAIFGGSYGGYAALMGLGATPQVFACAVSVAGYTNLVTLLESVPVFWREGVELFAARVGDHRTDAGRAALLQRSPATFAPGMVRPLLLVTGENDPRSSVQEAAMMVASLQSRAVPVVWLDFAGEGHGLERPENRAAFYAVAEQFLAAHLGGRAEPIGAALAGSTLEVRAAGGGLAGLPVPPAAPMPAPAASPTPAASSPAPSLPAPEAGGGPAGAPPAPGAAPVDAGPGAPGPTGG